LECLLFPSLSLLNLIQNFALEILFGFHNNKKLLWQEQNSVIGRL